MKQILTLAISVTLLVIVCVKIVDGKAAPEKYYTAGYTFQEKDSTSFQMGMLWVKRADMPSMQDLREQVFEYQKGKQLRMVTITSIYEFKNYSDFKKFKGK